MGTLDEIKSLIVGYQEKLKDPAIDDMWVITVGNMTLNKISNNRFDAAKTDWPTPIKSANVNARIRTYSSKFSMPLVKMPYDDWLKREIKKLQKFVDSTKTEVKETVMDAFKEIDHPEPCRVEEEEEDECVSKNPYNIIMLDKLDSGCYLCNNCLLCKNLISMEYKESKIHIKCKCV